MNGDFEKYNLVNAVVDADDAFDYIGATLAKDNGNSLTYTCPYHTDDIPSLNFDKSTGKFNCFACDCQGLGAYGLIKHHLSKRDGRNPTPLMVVTVLIEIEPEVEKYRYLFAVRAKREYDYSVDKRKAFNSRPKVASPMDVIMARKKTLTPEQCATLVDGIMTGVPDELLLRLIDRKKHKEVFEESKEFLSLLAE